MPSQRSQKLDVYFSGNYFTHLCSRFRLTEQSPLPHKIFLKPGMEVNDLLLLEKERRIRFRLEKRLRVKDGDD